MANRKFQITGDGACTLSSGSVDNEACSATSGKEIDLTKQRHLIRKEHTFGFDTTSTPTTKTFLLYRAKAAGTVRNFTALLVTDGSSTSITFDLKKNGTSVLSAAVSITDSTGDGTAVAGTISTPTYVAGDKFTVVMTVTSSTGAQGPFCDAEFDEVAS